MLLAIFRTFFKIGAFTIGGGYAMVPVIQEEVVTKRGWLSEETFLDSLALTNSLPGPIAINTATFVGYRIAGLPGALAAVAGAALPSFLIILGIALFFTSFSNSPVAEAVFAGIRPGVVALIAYAVTKLVRAAGVSAVNLSISIAVLLAVVVLNVHPIIAIVAAATFGLFFFREGAKA